MIIRPLTESDVDIIVSLDGGEFSDGWNKEMLTSSFATGRLHASGCFIGEVLSGYITFMTAGDSADIETVLVSPKFRKMGIATGLIVSAQETLKKLGVKKFFLEVRKSNFPAIGLYEKAGFTEISIRKKYYSNGEDAVIMIKEF